MSSEEVNMIWIDIDLEQPQPDFEVIVCADDDVGIDIFRENDDGSYYFDEMICVTHWMHKPEPFSKDE